MIRMLLSCAVAATMLGACGGADATMPEVTGERLDVALSDLDAAGISKDDVNVVGGGVFGVLDESNWKVCDQEPSVGDTVTAKVRVIVDRSCGGHDKNPPISSETPSNDATAGKPVTQSNKHSSGQGGKTFAVPALVGRNLQRAQDQLQSVGSYVLDQRDALGLHRFQILDSNWKVCSQSPAPGTEVKLAHVVTLAAVKLNESCP